jgi:hypothetical protein
MDALYSQPGFGDGPDIREQAHSQCRQAVGAAPAVIAAFMAAVNSWPVAALTRDMPGSAGHTYGRLVIAARRSPAPGKQAGRRLASLPDGLHTRS